MNISIFKTFYKYVHNSLQHNHMYLNLNIKRNLFNYVIESI